MDPAQNVITLLWQDDVDELQRRLEAGTDPNARLAYGQFTPLMQAQSVAAVELLLRFGANLDLVDEFGNDAFDHALRQRHEPVARRLWEAGADANRRLANGWTRLHYMAFTRNPVAVALLLTYGADPALERGRLLSAACWSDTEEEPGDTEHTIERLLAAEEDVHAADLYGYTALHCAVHPYAHTPSEAEWWNASSDGSDPNATRVLLRHGADPNVTGQNGMTPLLLAARGSYGAYACIETLLEAGAEIERSLFGNITPLMCAARAGELPNVRVLLEHGADASRQDRWGHDAAYYAREYQAAITAPPDASELPESMRTEENLAFMEREWKRQIQDVHEILTLLTSQ